jgi:hypothetical protein
MIFWSLCAFIWFKNIEKMLLQMTNSFLQLESTIDDRTTDPKIENLSCVNIAFLIKFMYAFDFFVWPIKRYVH